MIIIILIITLIRKFLKRVDHLASSGLLQVSWSHTGVRPTGQQPYAELEFTGVVKMLYIRRISWMYKWKISKYKNNGVKFFILITPLYWRARFKNDIEVIKYAFADNDNHYVYQGNFPARHS